MNYAVVILAFVMIVACAYWFIHGRTYYYGPRVNAHVIDGAIVLQEDSAESSNDQEKAVGTSTGLDAGPKHS
jgi:hypothetical protein